MKVLFGAVSLAVIAFAAPALAQEPAGGFTDTSAYGSIGYSRVQTNGEDELADINVNAVTGRAGIRFGRYVGVEGEVSFGAGSETVDVLGVDVEVELDASFVGYLVGAIPITPNAEVFARVGYGRTGITASNDEAGVSSSASEVSVNYGIGGSYFFDGRNGVRLDYTRFNFEDSEDEEDGEEVEAGEFDVFSISYIRRF